MGVLRPEPSGDTPRLVLVVVSANRIAAAAAAEAVGLVGR
jgi:hypothetical protein